MTNKLTREAKDDIEHLKRRARGEVDPVKKAKLSKMARILERAGKIFDLSRKK